MVVDIPAVDDAIEVNADVDMEVVEVNEMDVLPQVNINIIII